MVTSEDIPCPGCGRSYDPDLFHRGRTIRCTCGYRVGPDSPVEIPVPDGRPRFIADAMLGRVARWLRSLGYDTAWDEGISDPELVRRAFAEGRRILTRDRRIFEEWRISGGLVIEAPSVIDALKEVVDAFGLTRPARLFTRCRICNAPLEPVPLDDVAAELPPRVLRRLRIAETGARDQAEGGPDRPNGIGRCPGCDRIYWEGSHTARMRAVIDGLFEDD